MPPELRCKARCADGSRCEAPARFVDPETRLCPAHDPARRQAIREAARKGGQATARKLQAKGVRPPSSFPLETYDDAERWLELILRAVLGGGITHHQARAAVSAVEAWMKAHDEGRVTDRLAELEAALSEWRRTGDPAPVLAVVE